MTEKCECQVLLVVELLHQIRYLRTMPFPSRSGKTMQSSVVLRSPTTVVTLIGLTVDWPRYQKANTSVWNCRSGESGKWKSAKVKRVRCLSVSKVKSQVLGFAAKSDSLRVCWVRPKIHITWKLWISSKRTCCCIYIISLRCTKFKPEQTYLKFRQCLPIGFNICCHNQ